MKKAAKVLLLIWDISLLPLIWLTVVTILGNEDLVQATYFNSLWGICALGITMLRILFLPYIFSVVLIALYLATLLKERKKGVVRKRDILVFILLVMPCILGLLSVEPVFWAQMGI